MGVENSNLNILIKTAAELAGAEQTAAALERDIGKAKALGQEYAHLEAKLKTARATIDEYNTATRAAGNATEEAGSQEAAAADHAEKLHINHRGLHQIFNMMGRETIPEFGHALAGLALYGVVGVFVALGSALMAIKDSFAEAAKKTAEYWDILDSGNESHVSFLTGQQDIATALYNTADAAEAFANKIQAIANAQPTIKKQSDDAIAALKLEAAEMDKLAAAQLKAAEAKIKQDFATGKITKQQEIAALNAMDDQAAAAKVARENQLSTQEFAIRAKELEDTKKHAAASQAAVDAANKKKEEAELGPLRRKYLLKNADEEIANLDKRKEKLEKIIEDWDKQDISDKVPWNNNYPQYQAAKKELESNETTRGTLGAMRQKLNTAENEHEYVKPLKEADAAVAAANAKLEEDTKRIKELETQLAEARAADATKKKYGPQINAAEQAARDTAAQTEIDQANRADAERAAREAERAQREADAEAKRRAKANDNNGRPDEVAANDPAPTADIGQAIAALNGAWMKKFSDLQAVVDAQTATVANINSRSRDDLNA